MDASTRSFNVYGKTEAGAGALKAARGVLSSSARRLLILIDGQRSIGELSGMLGVDVVEMGLAQLEPMGFVEFLRHFPDPDEAGATTGLGAATTLLSTTTVMQPTTLLAATTILPGTLGEDFDAPVTAHPDAPPDAGSALAAPPGTANAPKVQRPLIPAIAISCVLAVAGALGAGYWLNRHAVVPADAAAGPVAPAQTSGEAAMRAPQAPASVDSNAGPSPAPLPSIAPAAVPAPLPLAAIADASKAPPSVPPVAPASATRERRPAPAAVTAAPPLRLSPPAPPPKASAPPPVTSPPATEPLVARTSLKVRKQVTPEIPKSVRDRGITSGHVVVILHVSPGGTVERVERVSASPPDVFDGAMEAAFAQWTFDPLGIPGRMTVDVDIRPPQ